MPKRYGIKAHISMKHRQEQRMDLPVWKFDGFFSTILLVSNQIGLTPCNDGIVFFVFFSVFIMRNRICLTTLEWRIIPERQTKFKGGSKLYFVHYCLCYTSAFIVSSIVLSIISSSLIISIIIIIFILCCHVLVTPLVIVFILNLHCVGINECFIFHRKLLRWCT